MEECLRIGEKENFTTVQAKFYQGVLQDDLWIWRTILRRLRLPSLQRGSGKGGHTSKKERLRFIEHLFEALRKTYSEQRLIVSIDDLHLGGEDFFPILLDMKEELSHCPILLIGAFQNLPLYRKGAFLSFLETLKTVSWAEELPLKGLSKSETVSMAKEMIGCTISEEFLEGLWEHTGGIPFFVQEVCRMICQNPQTYGNEDLDWEKNIPESIRLVIENRLSRLPDTSLRTIYIAAMLGERFTLEDLRFFSGKERGENLAKALEQGVAHGFLIQENGTSTYRFCHGILYDTIRSVLPLSERETLCLRMARRFEEGFTENRSRRCLPQNHWNLKLAEWWSSAGTEEGRVQAERYTRQAADDAYRACKYKEAEGLYESLVDLSIPKARNQDEAELFYFLGRTKFFSSSPSDSMVCLKKSFAYYKDHKDMEGMMRIAAQPEYLSTGYPGHENFFEEIIPLLAPGSLEEAKILIYYGVERLSGPGDFLKAEKVLMRALSILSCHEDRLLPIHARIYLVYLYHCYGRADEALKLLEETEELCRENPDSYAMAHILYGRGMVLPPLGRKAEAASGLEDLLAYSLSYGDPLKIGLAFFLKAQFEIENGDWDTARHTLDRGLDLCPDHPSLLLHRAMLEYSLGQIDAGDSFKRRIERLKRQIPPGPYAAHLNASAAEIVRTQITGETANLRRALHPLLSAAGSKEVHPHLSVRAHLLLTLAGYLLSDQALVKANLEKLKHFRKYNFIRPYFLSRVLGLAAYALGNPERAVIYFNEALHTVRNYQDKPMEGWILYESAKIDLSTAGNAEKIAAIRKHLWEAHETALSLSMKPLQKLVETELEKNSCLPLSRRELEVLALLSAGLSNEGIARELNISIFTVVNHVHNILRHTGTSNRTEAVAVARHAGLLNQ